jgi:hypothetical protein
MLLLLAQYRYLMFFTATTDDIAISKGQMPNATLLRHRQKCDGSTRSVDQRLGQRSSSLLPESENRDPAPWYQAAGR